MKNNKEKKQDKVFSVPNQPEELVRESAAQKTIQNQAMDLKNKKQSLWVYAKSFIKDIKDKIAPFSDTVQGYKDQLTEKLQKQKKEWDISKDKIIHKVQSSSKEQTEHLANVSQQALKEVNQLHKKKENTREEKKDQ